MMNDVYTPKQRELMNLWKSDGLKRINILCGGVSGGKTWVSLVLWAFWVASFAEDGQLFLMAGKSMSALKRNCLSVLQALVGEDNFTYSSSLKEGTLFGKKIVLEGASDARAENKIRGLTLAGAYCDEVTTFPEDFFVMLTSRLRVRGAKLFATTNPDGPWHWLKKNYLDRKEELDILEFNMNIDDNASLDPQYVENIKKEYTGVFYERFIKGEWTAAEGLVYPMFSSGRHVVLPEDIPSEGRYFISVDYGTANPCSMGLWVISGGKAYRISEFYYSGRKSGRLLTDEEYCDKLIALAGGRNIEKVIIDPSAASFKEALRRRGRFSVRDASNDVINGIRTVSSALQAGRILISSACKDSIREFGLYSWDENAGMDRIIKENDHAMDDIRYFCNTVLKRIF